MNVPSNTGLTARHASNGISKAALSNRYIRRALTVKIDKQPKKRKMWINKRIIVFGGRDFENDS